MEWIRDGILTKQMQGGVRLADGVPMIGGDGGEGAALAVGPANVDLVGLLAVAEAEVQVRRVRREITACRANFADLRQFPRLQGHAGAQRVRLAVGAEAAQRKEMTARPLVVQEQRRAFR